jgi:outer membrane protein
MLYPLDQPLEIRQIEVERLPGMPTETVAELYDIALSNLPEIARAELNIEQSKYGEKIAKGSLQPSLRAFGNVNTVYSQSGKNFEFTGFQLDTIGAVQNSLEPVVTLNPTTEVSTKAFSDQLTDNLGQQLGVSLSVPIFNGLSSRTAVENAKVNTQISELNLLNTKAQLRNDITTAYTNLKIAKSRYDAAASSLEAQRMNFDFSQKRFDAGMLNSTELLTAKNQWNQTQIQALNAKYEYVFRKLIIDFYKGEKLKL